MTNTVRIPPSETLLSTGLVAVLRMEEASEYEPVVRALSIAGVKCIELTLTTEGTIDALPELAAAIPDVELGVGTVRTPQMAEAAIAAGAKFLVTPTLKPEVIAIAQRNKTAVYGGAFTPSEVEQSWNLGVSAVKVFPASTVGPEYARHLAGPFPDLLILPSGGIQISDIGGWIKAGSAAVSLGSPLIGSAAVEGDLSSLAKRAREALTAIDEARST